jgi:Zn-dependent protease
MEFGIMWLRLLWEDPVQYIQLIAIIIVSICLHELAHGFAALGQGDETPRQRGHMTLDPLVHMGWESILFLCVGGIAWGSMPVNPCRFRSRQWGKVFVAAAGPLSNLAIGLISIGLLAIEPRTVTHNFFYLAAQMNLVLFMFNLLPIPQSDGFYIFSKFLPELELLDACEYRMFILFLLMASGLGGVLYAMSDLVIASIVGTAGVGF